MPRIVVTGAAGALGSAVVRHLAAQGAQVIAVDVAPGLPDLGQTAGFGGVDLTSPAAVDALFAALAKNYGAIDGLANIAGGFRWETLADADRATWDLLYRLNLGTAVNCCKAALPLLIPAKGAVVNVGAAGAAKAGAGMGAYAASKAGVAKLTEALADEVKTTGVRVNAVLPSIIDTPANRADMPGADFSTWVSPANLAGVIGFLLSAAASDITGACIPVTGRV